jgi:hypothetical protein
VTLGELQQQLIVGEVQQQQPFKTLPARHCFSEREEERSKVIFTPRHEREKKNERTQ